MCIHYTSNNDNGSFSASMSAGRNNFDINAITEEYLTRIAPAEVIKLALALKDENKKLLETILSCIEISGIPNSVADNDIEDAVIKVLKTAKAKVHTKFPSHMDIQAAHRKGKKGVVICKFVNRKFAYSALYSSANLKDADVFETGAPVYVNPSLCPEFGFLHFAVRKAKKDKRIHSYKVRHGVMMIKLTENDEEVIFILF